MTMILEKGLNFRPLLTESKRNAMTAVQHCQAQYARSEKAHHDGLYDMIGFLAAFVVHLRGAPSEKRKFMADTYWDDKPHEPKEKNLVRLAAMYVIGAKESKGALYQQALTYARVVEYFIAAEASALDIPAILKRKTIYGIMDKIRRKDEEKQSVTDAIDQQKARAKDAKRDDTVQSPSREDEAESSDDEDDKEIASDEDEAVEVNGSGKESKHASTAATVSSDQDNDQRAGLRNAEEQKRSWERDLIKRARAAWNEGKEVLLVPTSKSDFDAIVSAEGHGHLQLRCEYNRSKKWQAIICRSF